MIKLEEISKFVLAGEGTGLELAARSRRVVRLELNTAAPCQLRLQIGAKDLRFLANVHGRETLTFIADGPVIVWPDSEDEVWWWCSEMESTAAVLPGAKIFTKIAERRARNPELERIAAKMAENAERRMSQLAANVEGTLNGLRAENEALRAERVAKRGKRPAAGSEAPSGDGKPLSAGAGEAGEDNDTGGGDGAAGD